MSVRFKDLVFENYEGALFKLVQTSTVKAYTKEFEALSNKVIGLNPNSLLHYFVYGLKYDIQREVMALCPVFIIDAIDLAELHFPLKTQRIFMATPQPNSILSISLTSKFAKSFNKWLVC